MESHGWDRKEGCGTGTGSCGDMKGGKFGNSKKMEHLMQHCRHVRDHSPPEGTAGFILSTWLAYVKDWWATRLGIRWIGIRWIQRFLYTMLILSQNPPLL